MAKPKGTGSTAGAEDVTFAASDRIERLTNILALLLVKGHNQTESIKLLSRAGFQPKEIAGLVGSTPNAVSVTVHKLKKDGKKSKAKRGED